VAYGDDVASDSSELNESDDDSWLEVEDAAAEVSMLRVALPRSPPRAADAYRLDANPISPARPGVSFCTASVVQRRRWDRLQAQPADFMSLPIEMYALILPHLSIAAVARLALCSKAWNETVAAAVITPGYWLNSNALLPKPDHPLNDACSEKDDTDEDEPLSRDCLHLVGALASLCETVAAVVELVVAMIAAVNGAEELECARGNVECESTGSTRTFALCSQ
jgi:hypothetical protein